MKLGILSDIHEDFHSLRKAMSQLEKKDCDELICLGDIAGYSAPYFDYQDTRSANLCWEIIKKNFKYIVPGNHDLYASRSIPRSNPGFSYPANWYNLPFNQREELGSGKVWLYEPHELESDLSDENKEYIQNLPDQPVINVDGRQILLSHYLFPDLSGSGCILPPTINLYRSHLDFLKTTKASFALFGHCHPEGLLVYQNRDKKLIKFGKSIACKEESIIGVPCTANGRNIPGYSILDTDNLKIRTYSLRPIYKRIFR